MLCSVAPRLLAAHDDTYLAWVPQPIGETILPATIGERLSRGQLAEFERGKPIPPFGDCTTGVRSRGR